MRPHGPHHAEPVGRLLREDAVERNAEVGPRHRARLDQLLRDEHHHRDRDRETDSLTAARIAGDSRVEADHLAAEVHQWPAAVARIDGGVGLDEVLELDVPFAQFEIAAALGRHDAERHGMR